MNAEVRLGIARLGLTALPLFCLGGERRVCCLQRISRSSSRTDPPAGNRKADPPMGECERPRATT